MRFSEKKELIRLLNAYKDELLEKELSSSTQLEKFGIKAQYEHARRITRKLEVEINREIVKGLGDGRSA